MKIRLFFWSIFFCCPLFGISQHKGHNPPLVQLSVDTTNHFQTIDHFGASDAWSCQFVGQWPDHKKEAIAQLLFSKEIDLNGHAKGIGLSLWRMNVGAGSAEQPNIQDDWRKAESFLQSDGSYDWTRQQGQQWFAKKAKEYGVEHLLLFANSPPVSLTTNGKAFAKKGRTNIAESKLNNYADYFATIANHFKESGLPVDYISPVNEPQWDWSANSQEGSPFRNHEITLLVKALNKELEEKNLHTKIDVAEAGKINYLFEKADKPRRGNQIEEFFSKDSKNYIGDLSHVSHTISGHSYFTTSPEQQLVSQRMKLAEKSAKYPSLKYWMSEYCILGENAGEINGSGRDLGMESALYMANVIHHDLTIANASAWHWWLAVSPYNYKDGLVYIDKNKQDGNFYESKMLWVLGNYSRFIRPGYKRVEVTPFKEKKELLVSGYQNPETGELILVAVNKGNENITIQTPSIGENVNIFVTSSDHNLQKVNTEETDISLLPASVTTIVIN